MAQRPITYPFWIDSGPNVIQPPSELAETGYVPGQAPDSQNINFLFGNYAAWIEYLDQLTNTGLPLSVIRLINGGNWSFEASTSTLAWNADANLAIPPLADISNNIPAGSVVMADGQIAYIMANLPTFSLGNTSTTSNPNEITGMNFTGNIQTGDSVVGPGIPNGTTVIGVASSYVTLSQNVTSNNTQQTYTFAPVGNLSVVVENETSFIPTINTILLARRSANVIYLGVNCTQIVLRDQEVKTLNSTGYFSVYQAIAGQNITAGQLCYISPGSADGGRTAGALYPLDVSSANQSLRGTYAGVVITSVTTGNSATVMYSGFFPGTSLMPGVNYYADPTNPGGITATQPNSAGARIEPVAFAVTSSILLFTGVAANQGALGFPIFQEDEFTGNGSTTTFTLSQTALGAGTVFAFVDGLIVPNTQWSFGSNAVTFTTAPVVGQSIEFKYIIANQNYIAGGQEVPANPSGDLQTYVLSGVPVNQPSTYVYVDGTILPSSLWSLEIGGTANKVIFNAPLSLGQQVYVTYFTSAASLPAGGGGGTISGAANVGSGVGVFNGLSGTILDFNSLIAGSNVSITYNGVGGIVIAATTQGIQVTGNFVSPSQFNPASGFSPLNANDQVAWLAPLSGGATTVTANPQIIAGSTIGQRLTIKGTSSSNYYVFIDGNGLSLNGPLDLTNNQACEMSWDGTAWSENSRRM